MVDILWVFFFFWNVLLMSWDQWDLIVLGVDSKMTIFSTGPWSWNCGILRVPSVPASAFATCGVNRRRMRQQQKSWKCWDILFFLWLVLSLEFFLTRIQYSFALIRCRHHNMLGALVNGCYNSGNVSRDSRMKLDKTSRGWMANLFL